MKAKTAVVEAADISGNPGQCQDPTLTDYMTESDYVPLQVYKKSFIRARTSKDGLDTGPEALFGKT